jgi:hypothetical protein
MPTSLSEERFGKATPVRRVGLLPAQHRAILPESRALMRVPARNERPRRRLPTAGVRGHPPGSDGPVIGDGAECDAAADAAEPVRGAGPALCLAPNLFEPLQSESSGQTPDGSTASSSAGFSSGPSQRQGVPGPVCRAVEQIPQVPGPTCRYLESPSFTPEAGRRAGPLPTPALRGLADQGAGVRPATPFPTPRSIGRHARWRPRKRHLRSRTRAAGSNAAGLNPSAPPPPAIGAAGLTALEAVSTAVRS